MTELDHTTTPTEPQFISAWDAVTDHYDDIGETVYIRIKGGRTLYENMTVVWGIYGASIRLQRLEPTPGWPRTITRYIKTNVRVELVPIDDASEGEVRHG